MSYEVMRGTERFDGLSSKAALATAYELIAQNLGEVYLFDSRGDPMGLHELELAVDSVSFGE